MTRFATDTALAPSGENRFTGHVPASWWVGAGPNGGFMAALAARAAGRLTEMPLASLTTHYLEAPKEGPIEVHAEITRQGRSVTFVAIGMRQEGRLVVQGGAVCAVFRDDTPAFDVTEALPMPPREDCVYVDPNRSSVAPLIGNYEIRMATDSASPDVRGWIRTPDDHRPDAPLLVAMTDAFMPPPMLRLGFGIRVPTLELTVHVRTAVPLEDPWVIGRFTSRLAAGGTVEEDGELWSADGRLLAMSRQLSLIR